MRFLLNDVPYPSVKLYAIIPVGFELFNGITGNWKDTQGQRGVSVV